MGPIDSLFEQHLSEVRGEHTLYSEEAGVLNGFLTYVVDKTGDEFYIREIFVMKGHRRKGVSFALGHKAEKLAFEMGCKIMAGTVIRGTTGMTESLKMMLGFGFKLHGWDTEKIVLVKEVTAQ